MATTVKVSIIDDDCTVLEEFWVRRRNEFENDTMEALARDLRAGISSRYQTEEVEDEG